MTSPCQGSDLSSLLGRLILKKEAEARFDDVCRGGKSVEGLLNDF